MLQVSKEEDKVYATVSLHIDTVEVSTLLADQLYIAFLCNTKGLFIQNSKAWVNSLHTFCRSAYLHLFTFTKNIS